MCFDPDVLLQISTLPEALFKKCRNLKHIDASKNDISEIPVFIDLLHHLEYLDLSKNSIGAVPVSINQVGYYLFNFLWPEGQY